MAETPLQGLPASPGLAIGRARVLGGAAASRETVPEATYIFIEPDIRRATV